MEDFIWNLIKDAKIPLKGHFNSKIDDVKSLEELITQDHHIGKLASDSIKNFIKHRQENEDEDQYDPETLKKLLNSWISGKLHSHDSICTECGYYYDLSPYIANHLFQTPINPRFENKECDLPDYQTIQLTLNVPSGRIVIANDLRGLILPMEIKDISRECEMNRQKYTKCLEAYGLIYIHSQNFAYSLCETDEKDTLCLTHGVDEEEFNTQDQENSPFQKNYKEGRKITKSLSYTDCSLCAMCLMDGDHYDKAIALVGKPDFNTEDRFTDRFETTVIHVTPGVYRTNPTRTTELSDWDADESVEQQSVLFKRVPHETPKIIGIKLPTMKESVDKLQKSTNPYNRTPLLIQRGRVDWSLGHISTYSTGGMGEDYRDYPEVQHDFKTIQNLRKISRMVDVHERDLFENIQTKMQYQKDQSFHNIIKNTFTRLPKNISSFAIAGLICGADTSIESLQIQNSNGSAHEIMEMIEVHIHYRNMLWGAAYEHNCVKEVEKNLEDLQIAIDDAIAQNEAMKTNTP